MIVMKKKTDPVLLEMINKTEIVELSDSELRTLALQSGSYSFWNDPCEDIYSLETENPCKFLQ